MNVLRIAGWNTRALWRRWLGLSFLTALTVAVCVTAFGLGDNVAKASDGGITQSVANRSILVTRGSGGQSPVLSTATVATLAGYDGVRTVEPRAQVSFGYKDASIPGVLMYATIARPSSLPPVVKGSRASVFPLSGDEVVLPARVAGSDLTPLLGRTVDVQITERRGRQDGAGATRKATVVGLSDPSWQVDGQDAAYATEPLVVDWAAADAGVTPAQFRTSVGYDQLTVTAMRADQVPTLLHRIQGAGYSASSLQQQFRALPPVLRLIHTAGLVLLLLLCGIGLLATFVVTSALVRQRTQEIGVRKAGGVSGGAVCATFLVETLIVGLISGATGLALGCLGSVLLRDRLRGQTDLAAYLSAGSGLPGATTLLAALALTVLIAVVGALVPARRAARLDPVAAIGQL